MKLENKPTSITLQNFTTESGAFYASLNLSFQVFGPALNSAPIVLVNHALTGNSQVIGQNGWWNNLIGDNKTIDTNKYTILAFNVPGNGFDKTYIENYLDFTARDIARLFLEGIRFLKIKEIFAKDFPEVQLDDLLVDASTAHLVKEPERFDAENLFNQGLGIV